MYLLHLDEHSFIHRLYLGNNKLLTPISLILFTIPIALTTFNVHMKCNRVIYKAQTEAFITCAFHRPVNPAFSWP